MNMSKAKCPRCGGRGTYHADSSEYSCDEEKCEPPKPLPPTEPYKGPFTNMEGGR